MTNQDTLTLHALAFRLGDLNCAIPADAVIGVYQAVTITPLPEAPAAIEGIINFRGEIVPVFDIRIKFKLPPKTISITDNLIIVRNGKRRMALRVDVTDGLRDISSSAIDPLNERVPDAPTNAPYVMGVAKLPEGLALIYDVEKFLSDAETAQLSKVLDENARNEVSVA